MSRWQGRTILLTGATRGIGAQIARLLLAEGAVLITPVRQPGDLAALAAAHPGKVHAWPCDLSDPGALEPMLWEIAQAHPDLSGVINNAAIMVHRDLTRPGDHAALIAREIAINLTAPLTLSVAALPVLARHPGAFICNVTSGLALSPKTDAAAYSATKAGLRSFTRALRNQCAGAGHDIQLTEALLPVVDTTLSTGDPKGKMPPARAAQAILDGIAAGRDEVFIGKAALLWRIYRLSPALAHRIMRRM